MTPAPAQPSDIAAAVVLDTLATLKVNADPRLSKAEVKVRRAAIGFNEVAETKAHPGRQFLGKSWGVSAWMLEVIMVVSALLRNYADLVLVSDLPVINAALSFMRERRAAGVVAALRQRLQVSARVRRDARWQVVPARELVPGDIARVRPGDIVPADIKLLSGAMTIDQSALTSESLPAERKSGDAVFSGSIIRQGEAGALGLPRPRAQVETVT